MEENTQSSPPSDNSYFIELNAMSSTIPFLSEILSTGITTEQLKLYIKYPMQYNKQIRKLSREMYNLNGQYSNICDYMVSAATLDFITVCRENSSRNQNKRKIFNQVLRKINHKLTTRDILRSLFLDGIYVGYLRDTKSNKKLKDLNMTMVDSLDLLEGLSTDDSLMIQPLYIDYVKVIGFQNNDYVVAFDMQYFDQFKNGLLGEIKNFPLEFAKGYLEYRKDGSKRWFKLDQKKTIVLKFKSNINEPWGRPLAISALNDMFFADIYTDSQRANLSENASTIRWLKQPMGEKQGQCSLNKDQQQAQYDNFKNAVFSNSRDNKMVKTTTLVLAPGTEVGKLETDNTLIKDTLTDENMKRISTSFGFASSALNGDGGANYSTLQVNVDLILTQIWEIIEQVGYQYTKVLNNLISSGKDIIEMIYLKTSQLTKDKDVDNAKELYTLGGGSRLYWIACTGADVDMYMSLMEYEREEKFDEKYPPHQTAFTATGDEGGRPSSNSNNPNTIKSKTNNTNNMPKPSTK